MDPSSTRRFSRIDRLIEILDNALATTLGESVASRPMPGAKIEDTQLDAADRRHAAGLMRINHTGEVCAQALYLGQAALAREDATRDYLHAAAREENDHLAWCSTRLAELDSRPSLLNPLWYAGAWMIGAGAAALSDRLSLGFVIETERQVEAHLGAHLERLPAGDDRSRAILEVMQADERRHADNAFERGGVDLPQPVPRLMALAAGVMKAIAYRI